MVSEVVVAFRKRVQECEVLTATSVQLLNGPCRLSTIPVNRQIGNEAFLLCHSPQQSLMKRPTFAGGPNMRTILLAPVFSTAILSVFAQAAQPTQSNASRPLVSATTTAECQLTGSPELPLDVAIYAKEKGETKIARFTGMTTGLAVLELPESIPRRAHVITGTGRGGFAIEGWLNVDALPLYATTNLPVVAGHVWIQGSQRVEYEGRQHNQVRVQRTTTSPFSQAFSAATTCNNLSLVPVTAPASETPRFLRGYSLDHNELSLSSEPKGDPTFKLLRSTVTTSVFFYGTDKKDDWVRLRYSGTVGIDAWAKLSDLRLLPKGERVDEYIPTAQPDSARLRVVESGRVVTVTERVPIRLRPAPEAPVVGDIEPATETLVLAVAAGWASVIPKGLNVAPPTDRQFWVEARKVGNQSKNSSKVAQ